MRPIANQWPGGAACVREAVLAGRQFTFHLGRSPTRAGRGSAVERPGRYGVSGSR